jgi:hypothetical protein
MTLLDPFIWVSPITIVVGVALAYLLGFPPALSMPYMGTMAAACFFGNFLSLGGLILGCIAYGRISDRRTRVHG